MTRITRENFTAAMEAAVADRGDSYVYPKSEPGWTGDGDVCLYSLEDGSPACLIGYALYLIDPKLMPSYEDSASGPDVSASFILTERGVDDIDLLDAAAAAQQVQDIGCTWGYALRQFYRRMEQAQTLRP